MKTLSFRLTARPITDKYLCLHSISLHVSKIQVNNKYSYVNYELWPPDAPSSSGPLNQALFLACGNARTACSSTVRRAIANISARCSRKYRATSAFANCVTASFHSAFAAFSLCAPRSSDASSRSCSEISEHANKYSNGGSDGSDIWFSPRMERHILYIPQTLVNTVVNPLTEVIRRETAPGHVHREKGQAAAPAATALCERGNGTRNPSPRGTRFQDERGRDSMAHFARDDARRRNVGQRTNAHFCSLEITFGPTRSLTLGKREAA